MDLTRAISEKGQRIRTKTSLNTGIWATIPDDLLILAFTARGAKVPVAFTNQLRDRYGFSDYETLEWLGDRVLELMATQMIFESRTEILLKDSTKIREHLVKNITLFCFMKRKGLCDEVISSKDRWPDTLRPWDQRNVPYKVCADAFEALLGVLFFYLNYLRKDPRAYSLIYDWFLNTWKPFETLQNILKTGATQCLPVEIPEPVVAPPETKYITFPNIPEIPAHPEIIELITSPEFLEGEIPSGPEEGPIVELEPIPEIPGIPEKFVSLPPPPVMPTVPKLPTVTPVSLAPIPSRKPVTEKLPPPIQTLNLELKPGERRQGFPRSIRCDFIYNPNWKTIPLPDQKAQIYPLTVKVVEYLKQHGYDLILKLHPKRYGDISIGIAYVFPIGTIPTTPYLCTTHRAEHGPGITLADFLMSSLVIHLNLL